MGAGLLRWQQSAVYYTGQRRSKSRMIRDAPGPYRLSVKVQGLKTIMFARNLTDR